MVRPFIDYWSLEMGRGELYFPSHSGEDEDPICASLLLGIKWIDWNCQVSHPNSISLPRTPTPYHSSLSEQVLFVLF